MRRKIVLSVVFFLALIASGAAQSKGAFQNKYLKAKDLYKVGDYERAVYAFKECMVEHNNNPFHIYGHYFCALSAYKAGMYSDGRFVLVELMKNHPDWPQLDEARYLMATIAFEEHDLRKAYKYISEIQDTNLVQTSKGLQLHYLSGVEDPNTMATVLKEYPGQRFLASQLAERLNKEQSSISDMYMLEYLIQDYDLDPASFGHGTFRESEIKSAYNVAVILPFKLDAKDPRKSAKYYEMAVGIEMAVDSLSQDSVKFNLFFYDSGQDSAKVAALLEEPEMLQMDLFIGPVYPKPSALISHFAHSHQINFVNPIYQNNQTVANNDFAYLWLPGYKEIGRQIGVLAADSAEAGEVVVLYGKGIKDSVIAHSLKSVLDTTSLSPEDPGSKFKVVKFEKLDNENMPEIPRWIRAANETEELKMIAVISEENLAGAYMVTALEEQDLHIPVFAPAKWMAIQTNTLEQYKRRNLHFYHADYVDLDWVGVREFRKGFEERMNVKPLKFPHSTIGYDLMLYWGGMMKQYGNLFYHELHASGYSPGHTMAGCDYTKGNSNGIVQILRFKEDYDFEWVNQPLAK